MSDTASLAHLHRTAQAKLAEREVILERREAQLREELEKIAAERADMEERRHALALTEQIYRDMGAWGDSSDQEVPPMSTPVSPKHKAHWEPPKALRARIGPQRYRVFISFRKADRLTLDEVASYTRLPFKRARDIVLSDTHFGFLSKIGDEYTLASAGLDLLTRFEAYKRGKGETLPTLNDPLGDDDREESKPEDQPEEENVTA